ncbi:hypothetical protein H6G80_31250 [Nostoc sp. FACHB-87]|uniref:hypothetical protein n=1 Tax=Nostocaceae TaxID=1162 RepID=UPI001682A864|nr:MULTISPECIES: hypothetical protein [Nostocaceae]MBD2458530.1 hypothetical protein [Nostoc sp. FACHB-87]MBD2479610.1 hypothetical protein [Anabaena sp. FACHB-83]
MCNVGHNYLSPLWMKAIAKFLRLGGRFWFLQTLWRTTTHSSIFGGTVIESLELAKFDN